MFLTLSEVPHQTLRARFLLRLQPPMPLLVSFITKMTKITGWEASPFKSQVFFFMFRLFINEVLMKLSSYKSVTSVI